MNYEYNLLNVSIGEGIATIFMNSLHNLNALGIKISEELFDALSKMENDNEIKVIILKGLGKGFSAGGDIKEMADSLEKDPAKYIDDLTFPLYKAIGKIIVLKKPVIASVHGFAMGAGCNIALCCDFVFSTKKARFSESFIKIGLIPAGTATYIIPRLVGHKKAAEMFFLGINIKGDEAEELGLITKAVENTEELDKITQEYAEKLARGPTFAFGKIKNLLSKTFSLPMSEYLELERQTQIQVGGTDDFKEGVNAFLEKRKPIFKGK